MRRKDYPFFRLQCILMKKLNTMNSAVPTIRPSLCKMIESLISSGRKLRLSKDNLSKSVKISENVIVMLNSKMSNLITVSSNKNDHMPNN